MTKNVEKRMLIAIRDNEERKAIKRLVINLGYNATVLHDGAEVVDKSIKENPAIVIIDQELPVIKGERVVQILRHNPSTKYIPVMIIANTAINVRGFNRNLDMLLLRPINLEEVQGRMQGIILKISKQKSSLGDKDIEGRLSHISLVDLLQMLHFNRKEGTLRVLWNDHAGAIYLKNGEIYDATLGNTRKEKALFRLLTYKEGTFEFIPEPIGISKVIHGEVRSLLMEGVRQYDELLKINKQLPEPNSLLKPTMDLASLPKGLKPSINEILNLIEQYPKVADLVNHSSFPDYEVYLALISVLKKGVLKVAKEGDGKEVGQTKKLLTDKESIQIREGITRRWPEMSEMNYGKILLASASEKLIATFIDACKELPTFAINHSHIDAKDSLANQLGELGSLNLHGGMEVVLYALPVSLGMHPLWRLFQINSIALIILWDDTSTLDKMDKLKAIKSDIISKRRFPLVHVFIASGLISKNKDTQIRENMGIRSDERIFVLDRKKKDIARQILFALLGQLTKEDYIYA